ncbi:sugar transferase [Lactobacillus corticis]|uniref:Sugar transferase n=1 Tax=Lactobacillus corticis TaxID=2201249 RepID=A0A916VHH6_9LACO|nr:sugar transferase [Lactobacillus corticis]GFZ26175.1 sugar transferase [Lactobacillus corticis]
MEQKSTRHVGLNPDEVNSHHIYMFFKRVFDFIISAIALIVLSPVFLIVAICIKHEDGGPIFYSQTRLGKGEKPFKMWKFRSMCVGADKMKESLISQNEVDGAMFKMKDDPRITKVGKVIRKYSIDELPQLWNVLCGDMSLVGPRPPLEREVAQYTDYDKLRLLVEPGCTGLWQVTLRNDASFQQMVELDLEYISKRSLWYDFTILVRTIGVIIKPNGAY